MIEWVKAFRLPVCLFASGLALVSFRMSGTRPLLSAVVATLLIACATMVQNDWRDRSHDSRKGKILALCNPRMFFGLVVAVWGASLGVSIFVATINLPIGLMLFGAIAVGLVYSETREMPLVPILLVAIVSASPALTAILAGGGSKKLWLVFLSAAFVVFGREIIKDLDDLNIDGGYKWTVPLAVGERKAKLIVAVSVMTGSMIALSIAVVTLPGIVLTLIGAYVLLRNREHRTAKFCIDLGMALAITALAMKG